MPNPSDEIKSKLDIVEVIREYVPLKAAGYNFRAVCPFHREKTPSFMVSPEKQIWHCFGCGKGGDVFSFVMEIEGWSFIEALRLLAKKAGVALKRQDPALTSKRNILLDIVEQAAKFYHQVLLNSPAAESARNYLKERALTEETIAAWQIGYSPRGWETLAGFLKGQGFGENEIFLAGLSVKKDPSMGSRRAGYYDRFRDRIMFPLSDVNGNVVGFTARVLPVLSAGRPAGQPDGPEKAAAEKIGLSSEAFLSAKALASVEAKAGKYINTPATMIYDKSKILFGLDKARMAIKTQEAAILVEGQMDAIMAWQNGFTNVIASSGTALTEAQVSLIKRYTNNLFLSFDMDKAGDLASERGIAVAMQAEMQIKIIELKEAKDPDECIRKNPAAWREAVKAAKPMMRYYFDKTFSEFNKNEYEGQRQSINILLPIIAKFGSKIEQDFWLKKLSQEIDAKENFLREKLNQLISSSRLAAGKNSRQPVSPELGPGRPETVNTGRQENPGERALKSSREVLLSELLLALGLKYPVYLEYIINHLSPEDLVGESHKLLYKNLIIYYNKLIDFWTHEGGSFDLAINYQDLKDWFNKAENFKPDNQANNEINNQAGSLSCSSLLDRLVLLADKDFYDYTPEQAKAEMINLVAALRANNLCQRRYQVIKLIAAAEKENSAPTEKSEKLKGLMEEFRSLTEEISLINPKP